MKRVKIITFKTKKKTQGNGNGNKLLTKGNRTNKIQKGNGLFTSSKKKNLFKKYENYINNILNFYFRELNDTINKKNFNKLYKYSYQKSFLKSLNTKYRDLMRKCIYNILIILYKKDKYHKSSNIVTSSNQTNQGKGSSLYDILIENVEDNNIVIDFFTTTFEDTKKKKKKEIKTLDNINDDKIKQYITDYYKKNSNAEKQIFYIESNSRLDRHFDHSNKKYIALIVKDNDIHIINNIFTQIKYYINYLKNNTETKSKKEKEVKTIKKMLKAHFNYLCNNTYKIAIFFIEYVKYKY